MIKRIFHPPGKHILTRLTGDFQIFIQSLSPLSSLIQIRKIPPRYFAILCLPIFINHLTTMNKIFFVIALVLYAAATQAKTLVVYYSYTNNVERIVNELRAQIDADVIEIEPAEKGLDYAANNYAIGSAQIAAIRENPDDAASYPAIDHVNVDMSQYSTIIIGAPLWWSNMAAPLQTFLFQYGKEMSDKNIGLIVSSASSGISGVESDAKRLVPKGKFLSPSLWIRSSQTSNAQSLLQNWLQTIDYNNLISGVENIKQDHKTGFTVYSLSGVRLPVDTESTATLPSGLYIINGKKVFISK